MPSEPPDFALQEKGTIAAYPVWEGGECSGPISSARAATAPPTTNCCAARHAIATPRKRLRLQLAAGARGGSTRRTRFVRAQPPTSRTAVSAQHPIRRRARDRKDGVRLYVCRHPQDRWPAIRRAYHYVLPGGSRNARRGARRKGGMEKVPTINGHIWVAIDDTTTAVYNWQYPYDPTIRGDAGTRSNTRRCTAADRTDLIPGSYRLKKNLATTTHRPAAAEDADVHRHRGINTQDMALQRAWVRRRPLEGASRHERPRDHRDAPTAARSARPRATRETPRGLESGNHRRVRAVDKMVPLDIRGAKRSRRTAREF